MVVLSCLRPCVQNGIRNVVLPTLKKSSNSIVLQTKPSLTNGIQKRWKFVGDRILVRADFFTERTWRDQLLLYLQIGAIPWLATIFLVNVFIGDAELSDIPDGYTPYQWEYQRHPISRFFAKHFCYSLERDYEVLAARMVQEDQKRKERLQYKQVMRLNNVHQKTLAWYRLSPPKNSSTGDKLKVLEERAKRQ